ncbi:hypothetical protein GCM10010360_65480 [Streptomyces nogalater]
MRDRGRCHTEGSPYRPAEANREVGGGCVARGSRAFPRRALAYPVTEAGIRQFLDVGTGLPTAGS